MKQGTILILAFKGRAKVERNEMTQAWERWRRGYVRKEERASQQEKEKVNPIFLSMVFPKAKHEGQLYVGAMQTLKDRTWRASHSGVSLVLQG